MSTVMTDTQTTVPRWARLAAAVLDRLVTDAPGRRVVMAAWAVNVQKAATVFVIGALMLTYGNTTTGAWVFLALHGSYGWCWLIKDAAFRDHGLEYRISLLGTMNVYLGLLALYWVLPWLFIARFVEPSGAALAFAIGLHTIGVVTMIASDAQRHWALRYRPVPGLIREGMFRYTRNPNYLGETMIYTSYAFLAAHWAGWLIVAYALLVVWLPRMYRKDVALSRHPGWAEYREQTGLLLPRV